jgi:conjugative relaxase-like TrwC/TraI family protein
MKQGADYYLNMARGDYYLKGGEPLGQWWGSGTTDPRINLSGTVEGAALKNLLKRYSPNGHVKLTQIQNHQGKGNRQGYDLTFSSSKSFSCLWSQVGESERALLQEIHARAVRTALTYLEAEACFVRRGKGGTELEKAKAIVAIFPHGASRAKDPNYHSHCLFMHVAIGESGTPGSIESRLLFQHKMAAGAVFRAEETRLLRETFGLQIERDKSCYRIKGVPKELEVEFSKRSQEIKAKLKEEGRSGAKAAAEVALKTRGRKEYVPRETLLCQWKEIGRTLGWGPVEARRLVAQSMKCLTGKREDQTAWEEQVTKDAMETLTSQQSTFTKRDLVRYLAEESQEKGIGADRVLELSKRILRSREVVSIGRARHQEMFSTKEVVASEKKMMKRVLAMSWRSDHEVKDGILSGVLENREAMTEEQRVALRRATRGSAVAVIEGAAGTGKTFLLDAVRAAYEDAGYTVIGAALSGVAADGLKEGANLKESKTIAKLLLDLKPGRIGPKTFHGKRFSGLGAMAKYAEKVRRPKTVLSQKTVLILDEAAMISTKELSDVVKAVHRAGGKCIMVGDVRQLQSIEAGGGFAAIRDSVGSSKLTQVIRQREEWQRDAAQSFAEGRATEGLKAYRDHGLLFTEKTRSKAISKLVADWKRETTRQEESLIFCGTRADAKTINRMCQKELLEAGKLGRGKINFGGKCFHVGDRVLFAKNDRTLGVRNGNLGAVVGVNLLREQIKIQLDRGKAVVVPLKEYEHLEHGYCVTTHKGQGKTVERAYALLGGSMQDREITYVQTSRARGDTKLYTDTEDVELEDLTRQMEKSHEKELATTVNTRLQKEAQRM